MKKSNLNLIILTSVLIYILACFMPAYVEARNPSVWLTPEGTEYLDYPGFACLLSGIFLPLGFLFGYWGTAVWLANAYYFTALFLIFVQNKRHWLRIAFAILSVIVGSTLMFFTLRFVTKNYFCWVDSLLSGYYLWLLSFITLLVGLLIDKLPATVKRWLSLIYVVGIIPMCICIIMSTHDKGDNAIAFDERTQSLVAPQSLDALVIDDGTHKTFLKRIKGSDSIVALKEVLSSFAPIENQSTLTFLRANNTYEVINTTFVRVAQQKIRIDIDSNGKAKEIAIPKEDGDNSFYFNMETQSIETDSYFRSLVIESDKRLYWLDYKGLKRNVVSINNLKKYFSESNDTILPLNANHTYIISNNTHGDKNVHRIKIHIDENGNVDSVAKLPTKESI